MASGASAEMPRYQCHKKVWALKIKHIDILGDENIKITPVEPGFAPFDVDRKYLAAHQPHVGGYYVVYDDGYKSFSPAKAFEGGYTRLVA